MGEGPDEATPWAVDPEIPYEFPKNEVFVQSWIPLKCNAMLGAWYPAESLTVDWSARLV